MSVLEYSVSHSGPSEENRAGQVTIEKAVSEDFERVYPLLLDFNISRLTKDDWRRIFARNWNSPEDFCGFLLLKDREVKGYLGLLFSRRTINGRVEKFCNMTSWIVKDDCRSQSLRLLAELLKLKDYTVTNFTASKTVAAILPKFGFTELPTSQQLLFPAPNSVLGSSKYRCSFHREEIRGCLDQSDRDIFDDHAQLDCRHLVIMAGDQYCYLVVKNRVYRHLPYARVHYLSNRALFAEAIDSVRTKICWRLRVAGLMVDERYLAGHSFRYAKPSGPACAAFFKSSTLTKNDIDTLYSEMILLHD
jgi:hypothetical protein